jgi:hypothetical protein
MAALGAAGIAATVWHSPAVEAPTETTSTTSPVVNDGEEPNFPGIAPDGATRRATAISIGAWTTNDALVAAGANGLMWAVAMATGEVIDLRPPEPVLPVAPVVFDGLLGVIGESGAWAYDPADGQWISLGEADRLLASTVSDRVWRRVTLSDPGVLQAPFQWMEIDRNGTEFRSMQRNRPVRLGSPELVVGLGGDVFYFDTIGRGTWRVLSDYGSPVAVGPNDLIADQCNRQLECGNVWYDLATAQPRGPLYDDLASTILVTFGALLSPDARIIMHEIDEGGTRIENLASRASVTNRCIWGDSLVVSPESELLACATAEGIELYDLAERTSVGFPFGSDWSEAGLAFVSNRYIAHE